SGLKNSIRNSKTLGAYAPLRNMKKKLLFLIFLGVAIFSFLLSALYFTDPQYRKEKIDQYKQKIEKRRPQ
ncbi:MAG: hypothetical protein WKI46_05825, partial [Aquificaceae bacterium]